MENQRDNQLAQDIKEWINREQRFSSLFAEDHTKSAPFLQDKLGYYHTLEVNYKKTIDADEKVTLRILKQEIKHIEKQLFPNSFIRLLNRINMMFKQNKQKKKQEKQLEKNLYSVKESVIKAGFGTIASTIEKEMQQGKRQFQIKTTYYPNEGEKMDFNLIFKMDSNNQYIFEGYHAILTSKSDHNFKVENFVDLSDNFKFTITEIYNLMAGRAVTNSILALDGKVQDVWLKLDFTDKDIAGKFQIKEFPINGDLIIKNNIKELKTITKSENLNEVDFYNSLQSGNKLSLTVLTGGKIKNIRVEVNPQTYNLIIYDENNKKISLKSLVTNSPSKQDELNTKMNLGKKNNSLKNRIHIN